LKVGIFTAIFEPAEGWTLEKVLRYLKKIGYEAVEISAKKHVDADDVIKGRAREIRRTIDKYGIMPSSLSYHSNHIDADPRKRDEINSKFKKVVQAAQQLEISIVNTFSGLNVPFETLYPHPVTNVPKVKEAWAEFASVFGDIVDFAAEHAVKIAVEVHFGYLVYNLRTAERMLREIDSKSLGFNYDPTHYVWQGIDPTIPIKKFGDKIFHVHAKDVEIMADRLAEAGLLAFSSDFRAPSESWRFRIPGYGNLNWGRLVEALREVGYDYVLSAEIEEPVFPKEVAVEKAYKFLKAYT